MSSSTKVSREEFRRQKDLDAARKAGTAPAEVDEEGNAINPHIPQFMSQAPWYLDTGKPSLKHQRKPEDKRDHLKFNEWYQRGHRESQAASKYRKGACENCGAITHKTKDCLERPRKKGAKWTNKDIARDELVSDLKGVDTDYQAKRDRWNGYDPSEHKRVVNEYEAVEEMRRKLREEEIDNQTSADMSTAKKLAKKQKKSKAPAADGDFGSSDSDDSDEDKYADKADMAGQKFDAEKRISIRNLRIREDRAKYLYNLDLDSAYYDPKSRSMREAPNPSIRPEDAQYAGDNFERSRGDVTKMKQLQLFAWQSEARGEDVHLQANPTVNELQHREYQQKKEKLNKQIKGSILDRYGGAEHFESVPKELLSGQTENYIEYTPAGQPIHNASRRLGASVSGPDGETKEITLFDGNHKKPFASYTDPMTGKAGYDCCYSTVKNSYCTGDAGKAAVASTSMLGTRETKDDIVADTGHHENGKGKAGRSRSPSPARGKRRSRRSRSESFSSSSSFSDSDSDASTSSSDDKRRRDRRRHRSRRSDDDRESRDKKRSRKEPLKGYTSRKDIGEGDVAGRLDKGKLQDALKAEDARLQSKDASTSRDKRARRYGEDGDVDVTEEQLEAYRMKNRGRAEDPMANYRDEGDV